MSPLTVPPSSANELVARRNHDRPIGHSVDAPRFSRARFARLSPHIRALARQHVSIDDDAIT